MPKISITFDHLKQKIHRKNSVSNRKCLRERKKNEWTNVRTNERLNEREVDKLTEKRQKPLERKITEEGAKEHRRAK